MTHLQQLSPLFPYTTLFRSQTPYSGLVSAGVEPGGTAKAFSVPSWLKVIRAGNENPKSWPVLQLTPYRVTQARTSDRKSTRLNSSHDQTSYAVFCLKKKIKAKPGVAAQSGGPGAGAHHADVDRDLSRAREQLLVA